MKAVRVRWNVVNFLGGLCDDTGYIVPAGKTLVVEYAQVNGPSGGIFQVLFSTSAGVNVFLEPAAPYEIPDMGREVGGNPERYNCIFMGRMIDTT